MSFSLFAQTTGKISGLIKDKSDSAPLPGANVYLENTSFGSASDESGRFTLINIPPGKYNLKIDMIGYKSMKMENISNMYQTKKSQYLYMYQKMYHLHISISQAIHQVY